MASRLEEVSDRLFSDGVWQTPILVERSSLVIMDGHHRRAFAIAHKLARVPCILLSYSDVVLGSRREDQDINPQEVIKRGMQGRLYPPKSTRHTVINNLTVACHFPLESLMS